ncbi:MAG: hypothetical protein EPO28_06335 [Saprospiraceae bacterium]|nr:MAG: hypothetical protein EPO28_06335 [Saprospiraceae bacterium]
MGSNIIDTNVLAVANGRFDGISPDCLRSCQQFLGTAHHQRISLDDKILIFKEYFRYASPRGQPGIGDAFLKWLWTNHANPELCELVSITPTGDDRRLFEEIPGQEDLKGFDPSDQKFLAVALGSRFTATINNATDSDWEDFSEAIEKLGIVVHQLCPGFKGTKTEV